MSNSIGVAFNFYREPNTLPGFLEHAARFFDDVVAVSAPPPGAPPDDESISILKKWGVRIAFADISEGFGVVRTRCLRESQTEFTAILDCDERMFATVPILSCHGTGKYPDDPIPNLSVGVKHPCFNQLDRLRQIVKHECKEADCIRLPRRHWMTWSLHRPCQDWTKREDWQLRVLRNRPYLGYTPGIKMHEQLVDSRTGTTPIYATGDIERGPFFDHFHVPAKLMEPEQRKEDIRIYDALDQGSTKEMWAKIAHKD